METNQSFMNYLIENSNDIKGLFLKYKKLFIQYNWMISDTEYNYCPDILLSNDYAWLEGKKLFEIIERYQDLQFIWAVFSAFESSISLQLDNHSLPYADGNEDIWLKSAKPQHPKASFEIISWDATDIIIITGSHKLFNDLELNNSAKKIT